LKLPRTGELTETQNGSARGVFLYLDRPLAEAFRIPVTLTLAPHVALRDPMRVRLAAPVVRAAAPGIGVGIAAVIEEFLGSASRDGWEVSRRAGARAN
jgi:hypothetical protein